MAVYPTPENSELLFLVIDPFAQYGGRNPEEIGLYVIFRPGPFICAEWDFGGMPS